MVENDRTLVRGALTVFLHIRNHTTVALGYIEDKRTLWPCGVEFDNLLPDEGASPYMKKPAK
jgi:hypothetical protein